MEDYQARGYIFESVVWRLLQKFGYINVTTSELRGRGASHQIDAYGMLAIPTAFMYPVRLICECKCFAESYPIKLHHMRSFVGVIKDISENYIIDASGNRSTPYRYTDVGCFFSSSSFTVDAQEYSWAHNIFIISFNETPILKPIIQIIKRYVNNYSRVELLHMTKSEIVSRFWNENSRENINNISCAIGIIDGVYPVALIGREAWLERIDNTGNLAYERIQAVKTRRRSNKFDTVFELNILQENINFSLPNIIASKIIDRIDKSNSGDKIFEIDVPYIKKIGENTIRRFLKIEVILPIDEKEAYIASLKNNIQMLGEAIE